MAYGTPTTPDDVAAYYTRIRHGRPPSQEQLDDLTRRYNALGGTSPLAARTAAQVTAVRDELDRRHRGEYDVRFGSKYEPPLIEDAAQSFVEDGVTRVVALVLAPHESSMSTAQYLARASDSLGANAELVSVHSWWNHPKFISLIGERVRRAVASIPGDRRERVSIYFTAHSLPQRILAAGDRYPEQLAESAALAAMAAGVSDYSLAWQSAGRTEEPWLGPDIRDAIREEARRGTSHVLVCPIGFVSDHLEVLYDLDLEATAVAAECGMTFSRTASLNDDPTFIALLCDLVTDLR
jgi:ferrochelatase